MKILITGIGIVGKSTLRRSLVKALRSSDVLAEHYDADRFGELRHSADVDCLDGLPDEFLDDVVYVIEDVHGPLGSSDMALGEYDLILYLKPDTLSHARFWILRIAAWLRRGEFCWEAQTGWEGTGKSYDPRNIIPILKEAARNFWNRRKWIREDLDAIRPFPHIMVRVVCTKKGPQFGLKL